MPTSADLESFPSLEHAWQHHIVITTLSGAHSSTHSVHLFDEFFELSSNMSLGTRDTIGKTKRTESGCFGLESVHADTTLHGNGNTQCSMVLFTCGF